MELFFSTLFGALFGGLVMWYLPYRRRAAQGAAAASDAPVAPPRDAPPAPATETKRTIVQEAQLLKTAYDDSGHPQELEAVSASRARRSCAAIGSCLRRSSAIRAQAYAQVDSLRYSAVSSISSVNRTTPVFC